ncbi:MAG: tetratricopeptide repeat protein [Candidatus Altiarchaeota archaeon]
MAGENPSKAPPAGKQPNYGVKLEHEYHNLANDYYKIGEFDKAIEHFDKALELKPDLLESYFNRGLAYTRKQEYDKALADLNKVVGLNPNLAEAYYTRGLVYEYQQNYSKAISDYDRALQIDPGYSRAQTQKDVAKSKMSAGSSGGGGGGGGGAPQPATGGDGKPEEGAVTQFEVLKKPNMGFKDVAGLERTKELIKDYIVYPLMEPELARKYGTKAGGGVLFYGPPGTGKTYIAKASAGECAASFIAVKISDIVDMYAGNTEKNLHAAFETARKNKPCILFFDEVDGMGGKRDDMQQSFERRAINQFLTEMDGVEYDNEGVLCVGATNAPWDVDSALRRAGRFSRSIYFEEPDHKTRVALFKLNLKGRPVDPKLNLGRLSRLTEGFSGADVKEVCNAAAGIPWKEALKTRKERSIRFSDFIKATSGKHAVTSSLPAWYSSVKKFLIEEEEDEDDKKKGGIAGGVFRDIFSMPTSQSSGGGDQSSAMTVKHKKDQEELLGEEERRLYADLIKDIKKYTDPMYMMGRKMKKLCARYVM